MQKINQEKVRFEIVENQDRGDRQCVICGGKTGRERLIVQVVDGNCKGWEICSKCLNPWYYDNYDFIPDYIEASLKRTIEDVIPKKIEELERQADQIRVLQGRIEVPSWEDFVNTAFDGEKESWLESHEEERLKELDPWNWS